LGQVERKDLVVEATEETLQLHLRLGQLQPMVVVQVVTHLVQEVLEVQVVVVVVVMQASVVVHPHKVAAQVTLATETLEAMAVEVMVEAVAVVEQEVLAQMVSLEKVLVDMVV